MLTGDMHGGNDCKKVFDLANKNGLVFTKKDYLIIAGDFGALWFGDYRDDALLMELNDLGFTILVVDGNHENHAVLDSLPVETWNGGKVHKIREHIIHLMRGQVFNVDGLKIFSFGGADSVDKAWRIPSISWWKREMPSDEEYKEGLENLEKHDYKVDIVITHTCPSIIFNEVRNVFDKQTTRIEDYLGDIATKLEFNYWIFGHFHHDATIYQDGKRYLAMYDNIITIDTEDIPNEV